MAMQKLVWMFRDPRESLTTPIGEVILQEVQAATFKGAVGHISRYNHIDRAVVEKCLLATPIDAISRW
jgi:hypothetical protein